MEMVPINRIVLNRRMREDFGDIEPLMSSIKAHGLLHPIVIDADNTLIAGGRRLAACRNMGYREIPVTRVGDLSEHQRREIELDENIRRKDLTEYERSNLIRRIADLARQAAPELRADSARNSGRGRPPTPGSYRDIEQRIGVPESTIRLAEQHVAAVEAHPDLESLPQSRAIAAAKARRASKNAAAVSITLPNAVPSVSTVRVTPPVSVPTTNPDEAATRLLDRLDPEFIEALIVALRRGLLKQTG